MADLILFIALIFLLIVGCGGVIGSAFVLLTTMPINHKPPKKKDEVKNNE